MKYKKDELLNYVGDYSQVFGIKDYTFNSGKACGSRALEVNGGALAFTVLPDRALDIASLGCRGVNLSWINNCGIADPKFYQNDGAEGFLRNFLGGMVTTCGLRQVGPPCEDEGEALPLHGIHMVTPAEQVCAKTEWISGEPYVSIQGTMKEAKLFGENLELRREIRHQVGSTRIEIHDTVENLSCYPQPLMIMYHVNFGYPLLDENAYMIFPNDSLLPEEKEKEGAAEHTIFQKPTIGFKEQGFAHDLQANEQGETFVALLNEKLGMGAVLRINKKQLPRLAQWKVMDKGTYVLGLEPANAFITGRKQAREEGKLEFIAGREERKFDLALEILDSSERIARFKEEVLK